MKKVTIKNLIDFKRKSEKSKLTFKNNLKKEKNAALEGGGDYWISCVSAICNAFKKSDKEILNQKITEIKEKLLITTAKITKTQFQRNIDILENFADFDLEHLKPKVKIEMIPQPKEKSIIQINGLPIEARPSFVFTFSENGSDEVGAVWFVAKLGGYDNSELGMFTDITYRYLDNRFSKKHYINTSFCIAVDVYTGKEVKYSEIENGTIPGLLDDTISQLNNL